MRALVLLLLACRAPAPAPTPGTPDDLAAYLASLAGTDDATREREVASWLVGDATWGRSIVAPYRALFADYVRAFEQTRPALVAQLARRGAITARRHYAGDPRLTPAEARVRWALPVQFPSAVAELDGAPIDAVFVFDGRWRALAGLDDVVLTHIRALDAACAELVGHAGRAGHCTELAWAVADAALRGDNAAFTHACLLAAPHCGNGSP